MKKPVNELTADEINSVVVTQHDPNDWVEGQRRIVDPVLQTDDGPKDQGRVHFWEFVRRCGFRFKRRISANQYYGTKPI